MKHLIKTNINEYQHNICARKKRLYRSSVYVNRFSEGANLGTVSNFKYLTIYFEATHCYKAIKILYEKAICLSQY